MRSFAGVLPWLRSRPRVVLTLVVLAALAPFLDRPLHVDDPLFVWMAKHILDAPFDPYGFQVNWYGTAMPMAVVMQNPPLAAYALALAGGLVGWGETALHAAFLLPAVGAALGTYELARRLCERPLFAALATVFTPAFLVSGTSLMADMWLLCFWTWAVALWLRGLEESKARWLAASALLACLAEWTKYFGVCLVPLLAVAALAGQRRGGWWAAWLAVPLLAMAAFEAWTRTRYGVGMFLAAGGYASGTVAEVGVPIWTRGLTALAFLGGCLVWPVVSAPACWRAPVWLGGLGLSAVASWAVFMIMDPFRERYPLLEARPEWLWLQVTFLAAGGLAVAALIVVDLRRRQDADAWLLACWVAGTLAFAAFLNWTVAARALLPLAPAVAILLARRLEALPPGTQAPRWLRPELALVLPAAVALLIAQADVAQAKAVRQTVRGWRDLAGPGGTQVWFEGHWGFQYYMEQSGARALDRREPGFAKGDLLVIPENNTNTRHPPGVITRRLGRVEQHGSRWISVLNTRAGGGFYSTDSGPLPFSFGSTWPEAVTVYELTASAEEFQSAQKVRRP